MGHRMFSMACVCVLAACGVEPIYFDSVFVPTGDVQTMAGSMWFEARVVAPSGVSNVDLQIMKVDGRSEFERLALEEAEEITSFATYRVQMAWPEVGTSLLFYLSARDGAGNTARHPALAPEELLRLTVVP